MANYKTRGIILRRSNLGEADRILTVFTKDRGKIRLLAKGVRKTLSKLAGHLELFCETELYIAEGRNLDLVAGAEVKKTFLNLRSDFRLMVIAYYLAEIIDKNTLDNDNHPEIFRLLSETFECVNNGSGSLVQSYFEINLLNELGFKPELFSCLSCHEKISPEDNFFSLRLGGLVCGKCQQSDNRITDQAIKVMRLLSDNHISVVDKIKAPESLVSEVKKITGDYLKFMSEKEFRTERYLS